MSTSDFDRGVMIDCGRKYFSPRSLELLIAGMSELGLDFLELHFSEDMGVGIECPAYPWLAGRDGILCTQGKTGECPTDPRVLSREDLRMIADCARGKGIRIIPSYDSPGHLNYTVKRFCEMAARPGGLSYSFGGHDYHVSAVEVAGSSAAEGESGAGQSAGQSDGQTSGRESLTAAKEYRYSFLRDGVPVPLTGTGPLIHGIGSYFEYGGVISRVAGTNNRDFPRGINIAFEPAVAFIRSVLDSYARMFREAGCDGIDIGGDELLGFAPAVADTSAVPRWAQLDAWKKAAAEKYGEGAVAYDLFVGYMNTLYGDMKKLGYREVRTWNDEFMRSSDTGWSRGAGHVQPDPGFTVQYWSSKPAFAPPGEIAAAGHRLINCASAYCYYVLTDKARCIPPLAYAKCDPEHIAAEWDPRVYSDGGEPDAVPSGAMFCIWCDSPGLRTDTEAAEEALPLIAAFAAASRNSIR